MNNVFGQIRAWVIVGVVLGGGWSAPGQGTNVANDIIPYIKFELVPLSSAIENLSRQAGLNCLLDPRITGPNVTFKYENMTASDVLNRLVKEHGLMRIDNPATSVTRIAPTNALVHFVEKSWIKADTNAAIPMVHLESMALDDAMARLAKQAGVSVELDPRLSKTYIAPGQRFAQPIELWVKFQNVTPRQVIAALCENYELDLNPTNNLVVISPIKHAGAKSKATGQDR